MLIPHNHSTFNTIFFIEWLLHSLNFKIHFFFFFFFFFFSLFFFFFFLSKLCIWGCYACNIHHISHMGMVTVLIRSNNGKGPMPVVPTMKPNIICLFFCSFAFCLKIMQTNYLIYPCFCPKYCYHHPTQGSQVILLGQSAVSISSEDAK